MGRKQPTEINLYHNFHIFSLIGVNFDKEKDFCVLLLGNREVRKKIGCLLHVVPRLTFGD
jgi:hypothetical protein